METITSVYYNRIPTTKSLKIQFINSEKISEFIAASSFLISILMLQHTL